MPDTYLFSERYKWFVQWLAQFTITHSLNVPIEAFEPHCRAKTSVIVLQKSTPPLGHKIIGAFCESFGEDKKGRPRFKLIDGVQTAERDDEMSKAAQLLRDPSCRVESKLHFEFDQDKAIGRGILVASYWWRKPYTERLEEFARDYECDLMNIGDLIDQGEIHVMSGHGSPSPQYHGQGTVPYVKVVEIKNWRINENPAYNIPEDVAAKYRRDKTLRAFDLVTPTRASRNIGLFGVIMPWQTQVILTKEIHIWRVREKSTRIDPWLLIALLSLNVVHDQFKFLVLMQTNREDLGDRYRELQIPIPRTAATREKWSGPIRRYFAAMAEARASYDDLREQLKPGLFADRP